MKIYALKMLPFPVILRLKITDTPLVDFALGMTTLDDGVITVVIYSKSDEVQGTCVHEAVHAV